MVEAKKRTINRKNAFALIGYQLSFLISLPFYLYYAPPKLSVILSMIGLLYLSGLSITGGYHRFYSHRSYKTHKITEFFLLFFGSMAGQGSALRWSFEHRLHHAHVDTDDDPYSIKKGFWYAHCLWLLEKTRPINPKVVSDLMKNPLVMFQHQWIGTCILATNAAAFLFFGWLLDDYLGSFFLVLWGRLFLLHHFTWFINSLAHTWGDKPFCQEQSAVNNFVISLLTFGEGYHNFHHTFANDYRNGVRWYHFDPTKWLIWTLAKLGLAQDLKQTDRLTIQKRMIITRRDLLLKKIGLSFQEKRDELKKCVDELAEQIVSKISHFDQLRLKYLAAKKSQEEGSVDKEIKKELRFLKKSLQRDWRKWQTLSRDILKAANPAVA